MLRKKLLSIATDWLVRKNKHIVNVTCYSTLNTNSHVNSENETFNIKNLNSLLPKKVKKMKSEISKNQKKLIEEKEIFNFIKDISDINSDTLNAFLKVIMKIRTNKMNMLYLVEKQVAVQYVSLIKDDLLKNQSFVVEFNPGFGVLTTELLKAGVSLIHLYEANTELHIILNKLHKANPDRLDLRNFNFLKFSQLSYIDKQTNGNRIKNILQGVKTTEKWEDQSMQVIGSTCSSKFFRHITFSLLFRHSLMSKGRTVFYIAIPPSLWHSYTCDNSNYQLYITMKVIFQAMFDYKLLGRLKRKAFIPWPNEKKILKSVKLNQKYEKDREEMFLVKVEPKDNLYSILSKEDWIIFWYFIRHNLKRRSNRVIPNMEKWAPGCGKKLITHFNYTIFTEFGNLTPHDLIKLFKEFQSWPEYKTCNFFISMRNSLEAFGDLSISEFDKETCQVDH